MGTRGMRASLMSREVIADSAELAVRGHSLDAVLFIVGCDKTIPAAAMAAARLDLPSVILYGGSIMPGHLGGKAITIQDVFEAVGAHSAGTIGDEELNAVETARLPRRRRLRRPVHRQHDGAGDELPRPFADRAQRHSRRPSGQAGRPRSRRGAIVLEALRAGRNARSLITADEPAQRRCRGNRDGRLDQPRPPPARDRARGGDSGEPSSTSTCSTKSRARRR